MKIIKSARDKMKSWFFKGIEKDELFENYFIEKLDKKNNFVEKIRLKKKSRPK